MKSSTKSSAPKNFKVTLELSAAQAVEVKALAKRLNIDEASAVKIFIGEALDHRRISALDEGLRYRR